MRSEPCTLHQWNGKCACRNRIGYGRSRYGPEEPGSHDRHFSRSADPLSRYSHGKIEEKRLAETREDRGKYDEELRRLKDNKGKAVSLLQSDVGEIESQIKAAAQPDVRGKLERGLKEIGDYTPTLQPQ